MPVRADDVLDALATVVDPELGVNIVDLGLVYDAECSGAAVRIVMTLTAPTCPLGSYLAGEAAKAVRKRVPAASTVSVELVWDPPWDPIMMSWRAQQALGYA